MIRHALSTDALLAAAEAVRRLTGLVFPESRRAALGRAVVTAMDHAGAASPEEYLARLAAEPGLLDALAAEITVGESYFFRDPAQLAHVVEELVARAASCRGRQLRVWSAGCATGEEPYSLAIALQRLGLLPCVHILGTDLSRTALARARRGRYSRWSLRGVADEVVSRYFRCTPEGYDLLPEIREAVEFHHLNLAEHTYPSLANGAWGMDVILCRNVLIYFDAETTTLVVRRLLRSLGEDGRLVLGASDPVIAERAPCEAVVTMAGLVYRRTGLGAAPSPAWARPATGESPLLSRLDVAPGPSRVGASELTAPALPAAMPALDAAPTDPTDPDSAVAAAVVQVRTLANAGRLAEAGTACAAALDRHRLSAELLYLHAILLSEAGRTHQSIAAARQALYLDRGLVVAHLALGAALARVGEVRQARRAFRSAERLASALPADAVVQASDGEPAGRLVEMVRVELRLLGETAA